VLLVLNLFIVNVVEDSPFSLRFVGRVYIIEIPIFWIWFPGRIVIRNESPDPFLFLLNEVRYFLLVAKLVSQ